MQKEKEREKERKKELNDNIQLVNGQPRPPQHMVGPGGPMGMNTAQMAAAANMQMNNNGVPFNPIGSNNGDMNLMLAQQMMNKGQMPAGLTPQQQQQQQQVNKGRRKNASNNEPKNIYKILFCIFRCWLLSNNV